MAEGISINKGLLVLGKVINALADDARLKEVSADGRWTLRSVGALRGNRLSKSEARLWTRHDAVSSADRIESERRTSSPNRRTTAHVERRGMAKEHTRVDLHRDVCE